MKTESWEIYSDTSNHAVVRAPGRQFPGSVIQGDALSALCADATELSRRLKTLRPADDDLLSVAQEIQERLLERLLHYQAVLESHGLPLPYSSPVTRDDFVNLIEVQGGSAA